jgi:hypothetical protein
MKWMRRLITLLLIAFALLSAGCIDIEIHTKMQADGSGVQTWKFTATALLASQIKNQITNNPFFAKAITRDQYKEGDYIVESSIPFKDVSELRNVDRDVRFRSEGWFLKTNIYTEVWKSSGKAGGFLSEHAKGLVPITLKIAVEMPGRVTETNADSHQGSTAVWTVPITDLASSKILTVTSRSINWVLLTILAIIVLAILAAILFFVYSFAKKSRAPVQATVPCPACGAAVPMGSTYCNFCGKELQKQV